MISGISETEGMKIWTRVPVACAPASYVVRTQQGG